VVCCVVSWNGHDGDPFQRKGSWSGNGGERTHVCTMMFWESDGFFYFFKVFVGITFEITWRGILSLETRKGEKTPFFRWMDGLLITFFHGLSWIYPRTVTRPSRLSDTERWGSSGDGGLTEGQIGPIVSLVETSPDEDFSRLFLVRPASRNWGGYNKFAYSIQVLRILHLVLRISPSSAYSLALSAIIR
jgi:hypothetical protein